MRVAEVQTLLAAAEYYTGAIDGDAGPKTWAAVEKTEEQNPERAGWNKSRRLVAAGQSVLAALMYEPGKIDGYSGHNTQEALAAFMSEARGNSSEVAKPVIDTPQKPNEWVHQNNMEGFYGPPGGPDCTAGKVVLPFPFTIAWNKSQKVGRFSCHIKLERVMGLVFSEAVNHYGEAEYKRLELDIFGGCYNNRNMRGGSRKSTHAWGAAVDLNPEKNQLRWGNDRAQFAKPDYIAFWNIVERYGGVSGGRAWGKDWMHFQFAGVRLMLKRAWVWVFGTGSGKREAAWLIFIAWCCGFVSTMLMERAGDTVSGSQSILELGLIPVLTFVAAAHGLQHLTDKGMIGPNV